MEQTFFMIKPDVLAAPEQKVGAILKLVNDDGFRILEMETRQFDRSTVEHFYGEHEGKDFFAGLVEYICSGPVVVFRLQRENAVRRMRELVGSTDPADAEPGTIRARFGRSVRHNAVHASASVAEAARELEIVFGPGS